MLVIGLLLGVFADISAEEPLPADLTLTTIDGEELRFGDLRGKVVFIDFWFTACRPCRSAIPHLKRVNSKYKDEPFVLISVSIDGDRTEMETYIQKEGMDWHHVWDPKSKIAAAFGVKSYPSYLVIDHEGTGIASAKGWNNRTGGWISRKVKGAIRDARKATD